MLPALERETAEVVPGVGVGWRAHDQVSPGQRGAIEIAAALLDQRFGIGIVPL